MASHLGRIVLLLNGIPMAELKSLNEQTNTGRKVVTGMAPDGQPIGYVDGTPEHTLDCEAHIPLTGERVEWASLTDAQIIIAPRSGVGPTTLYTGVFCTNFSGSYSEQNEATRKVQLAALRRTEIGL